MLIHTWLGHAELILSQLPHATRHVLLNIGSNLQPVRPPPNDNSTVAIVFEPIVAAKIVPESRLYVVSAAVSDESGLTTMGVFNQDGVSSSLASMPCAMRHITSHSMYWTETESVDAAHFDA